MSDKARATVRRPGGTMSRRTFFKALAGVLLSAGSVALLTRTGTVRREEKNLSRRRAMHYRNLAG